VKKLLLILLCFPLITLAQQTYVPDDVFEAYLEQGTNGIPNDDSVLTNTLNLHATLYLSPSLGLLGTITDLTGIEDCKSLLILQIEYQQISELDLTQTKFNNHATSSYPMIAIKNNHLLEEIILPNDSIGMCHISYNSFLKEIIFSDSTYFGTQFSVTDNPSLSSCDMSVTGGVIGGASLQVYGNDSLELLNLSNGFCNNWGTVSISSNPILFCIQVDNPNYSEVVWTWDGILIDPLLYSYSTNCGWPSAIEEYSLNKELLKVTDLLGRETKQTNQPLFYIYDDGTVEKRIVIE
jgi:hypothetical protein